MCVAVWVLQSTFHRMGLTSRRSCCASRDKLLTCYQPGRQEPTSRASLRLWPAHPPKQTPLGWHQVLHLISVLLISQCRIFIETWLSLTRIYTPTCVTRWTNRHTTSGTYSLSAYSSSCEGAPHTPPRGWASPGPENTSEKTIPAVCSECWTNACLLSETRLVTDSLLFSTPIYKHLVSRWL